MKATEDTESVVVAHPHQYRRQTIVPHQNYLKGLVLHPRPILRLFVHFLKNYVTLVTSKICFL